MSDKKDAAPVKSIEKLQLELRQTLNGLCCLSVVQASSRGGDIRVLCRCPDRPAWLLILREFLAREEGKGWYSFIGQKYMLVDGELAAAWMLVFEADDLDAAVQEIRRLFMDIHAARKAASTPQAPVSVPVSGFGKRALARISTAKVGQE